MILATALLCMSLNIYHESRGESLDGQRAVALVTWNRAEHEPKKVCDVVTKPKQFSWVMWKVKRSHGAYALKDNGLPDENSEAWRSAMFTARLVLKNKLPDTTKGATFYHADYAKPIWRHSMRLTVVFGHHIFYKLA